MKVYNILLIRVFFLYFFRGILKDTENYKYEGGKNARTKRKCRYKKLDI